MTVLVAYASVTGGTAEIAEWIADELRATGLDAHSVPAGAVPDIAPYEAVVLGSALHMSGWHADARRFAQRFGPVLAGRPAWVFSSGPLEDAGVCAAVPPCTQAVNAMRMMGTRDHATFGGRLSEEAHGWLGFVSRRMAASGHGGDFRDPARVRAWAREIAGAVQTAQRT
ncbi:MULTISPECIES: flavodoxin domain-containing protein [Catenuloplanes]|uniref:Menaquinone-dependent protoporphyrinogen oxidase n=1 Tax=Catenuloplanes niger TaxID=587534 RepID=A0AAE4D065_9ACTN|nr:flavodoxin domain-containing protein [Catenuloplanes niger]MDR7327614.1 menaquinone-dependent protoporphyrinogen oxidase [Catenuloplanes niger]